MKVVCPVVNENARTCGRVFARHVWETVLLNGWERQRCLRCKLVNTIGVPPQARFWDYVDKNGPEKGPGLGPCWIWKGYTAPDKYGRFSVSVGRVKWKHYSAHGYAWLMEHGSLPTPPMTIDHMCYEEGCVRVSHMRELSHSDNVKNQENKDLCRRKGHPLVGDNVCITKKRGGKTARRCRICRDAASKAYRESHR